MAFTCPYKACGGQSFSRKDNLSRHVRNQHGNLWSCSRCNQNFNRYDNYSYHERVCIYKSTGKGINEEAGEGSSTKKHKSNSSYSGGALDGVLSTYTIQLENEVTNDPLRLLKESVIAFEDRVVTAVNEKNAIKLYLSLHLNFHLNTDDCIEF